MCNDSIIGTGSGKYKLDAENKASYNAFRKLQPNVKCNYKDSKSMIVSLCLKM